MRNYIDDPFRAMDQDILRREESWTPVQRQAAMIAELEAKLKLADERIYWLVGELATANAKINNTTFKTHNL